MDEAGRLIAELQQKLKELDHRVWLYRRDMTLEFTRHAETLLRDVPQDISNTVSVAIAQSLKEYPSLWPPHEADSDCTNLSTIDEVTTAMLRKTAIPIFLDNPKSQSQSQSQSQPHPEPPRSPHAREQEFQGLFTPTYLPLLDSSDRHERQANGEVTSPPMAQPEVSRVREATLKDAATQKPSQPSSPATSDRGPLHPLIKRRSTDDGSAFSSSSNSPVRRSALRHSTGSVKIQSPRRVRFEFEGEEFPTTSSPRDSSPIIETARADSDDDDDGDEPVTKQIEYMESSPSPPPKRVSSSQALRALSRQPMEDDGTQWTTVSAPADGSPSVPVSENDKNTGDEDDDDMPELAPSRGRQPVLDRTPTDHDSTETDEDVFPPDDMPPLMPMKPARQVTILSPTEEQNVEQLAPRHSKPAGKPMFTLDDVDDDIDQEDESSLQLHQTAGDDDEDDDDDMFSFDESSSARRRPSAIPEEDEEEESDTFGRDSESSIAEISLSQYATSPARAIVRPKMQQASNDVAASSSMRGSFHPFNTPVVNEVAHAQAASLGAVNTFVGSLRDQEYQGSYRYRSSTPQASSSARQNHHPLTMMERMRNEEIKELEAER